MKRVLLVDDSPSVVTAAYDELEARGYLVEVAYNGKEAIQYLDDNPDELPDLVIMDIEMPKMRGDEATRLIRQNPEWRQIPVIALTGKAPETLGQSVELFNGYLIKPFGFEQMLKIVEQLIGKAED